MVGRLPHLRSTFSIPNRIEPSATLFGGLSVIQCRLFQYPQSDRALCNSPTFLRRIQSRPLSVSPIGSSPLQLTTPLPSIATMISFSIPNRIEPSATPVRPVRQPDEHALSVSPIGSSPLQQCEIEYEHGPEPVFQYPQSDRALCNQGDSAFPRAPVRLSVSPIGSSPLQPGKQAEKQVLPAPFSIPNRIEPSATWGRGRCWTLRSGFQYPQSDRALCNLPARLKPQTPPLFQYPQSDRALCNPSRPPPGNSQYQAFSIPNRIEPSATGVRYTPHTPRLDSFSIPNRIEPSATSTRKASNKPIRQLSVSPIGSSPLQQYTSLMIWYVIRGLSVSPIGSSPLQHGAD